MSILPAGYFAQQVRAENIEAVGPVAAAADGGPRRWEVSVSEGATVRAEPAADATIAATLEPADLLQNLGCEDTGGAIWCRVQPLGSRLQGYVMLEALDPARGPDGVVPMGIDASPGRAAQGDFDATGQFPCAQIEGATLGACTFGVARETGGDATIDVTFSNGFRRTLFFTHGQFRRANPTMSGTGVDTDWQMTGDRLRIRVDDQRFELPTSFVFGS